MNLLPNFKKECQKIASLPPGQRWDYFVSYYLWWCLGLLFALACLFLFFFDVKDSRRELVLSGILVNTEVSPEGQAFLTEGFLSENTESRDGRIYAEREYILFAGAEDTLDQYRRVMALTAQVAAGEVDYLILDRSALEGLSGSGIFCDAAVLLEEEDLSALRGLLIPVQEPDPEADRDEGKKKTGEERASEEGNEKAALYVLSLEGTAFAEAFSLSPRDAFLALTCLPKRYERGSALLRYLLSHRMLEAE